MALIASDPRYQRRLQMARARALYGNRPRTEGITAQFAARNIRKDLAFQRLGLQKLQHQEQIRQIERAKTFTLKDIRNIAKAKSTAKTGALMGLGTAVVAGIEGRRRKKKIEAQVAKQDVFNQGILSALDEQQVTRRKMLDIYNRRN